MYKLTPSHNGLSCCKLFHVASVYANLLEQKKEFGYENISTPTELVWDTNMAAVSLFWNINMAAVTACENTLYCFKNSLTFVNMLK